MVSRLQSIRAMTRNVLIPCLVLLLSSCATTSTTSRTWVAPPPPAPAPVAWSKPGRVESVQEIVQRVEAHPAGGALAGALIGGFLFGHHGHASLFGAVAGAAVGAAASQHSRESRTYHLLVRFQDGSFGMFVFSGAPPFQPGQPVALTPQGLLPL
jgi:outer membrane lipoprotein SlyB